MINQKIIITLICIYFIYQIFCKNIYKEKFVNQEDISIQEDTSTSISKDYFQEELIDEEKKKIFYNNIKSSVIELENLTFNKPDYEYIKTLEKSILIISIDFESHEFGDSNAPKDVYIYHFSPFEYSSNKYTFYNINCLVDPLPKNGILMPENDGNEFMLYFK